MRKRRSFYLSDFVIKQYPTEKLKNLIIISLDIVENFLAELEAGFNYDSSTISSYEQKYYMSSKPAHSRVESLYISNINNEEEMKKFLDSFYYAYNCLNREEKQIFDASFVNRLTDQEIMDKYNIYSHQINTIRKSAIVRFSLRLGLDKFVDIL